MNLWIKALIDLVLFALKQNYKFNPWKTQIVGALNEL